MRPWSSIPIGLLAFLPLVAPAQLPLPLPLTPEPVPAIQSFTLLEALYNDTDYVSLIKLIQRARLIPTFNRLNGSTFFAPTNDAISRYAASNELWELALRDDTLELQDNLQLRLRQQLFYHLLNYTLLLLPTEQTPQEHITLLYPRDTSEPPSREPPPSPPWVPIQNGTLGTDPQRLRLSARDAALWAGVDAFGNSGAKIVKDHVNTSNGLLLGLDSILEMPPDLGMLTRGKKCNKILTCILCSNRDLTTSPPLLPPQDSHARVEDIPEQYADTLVVPSCRRCLECVAGPAAIILGERVRIRYHGTHSQHAHRLA